MKPDIDHDRESGTFYFPSSADAWAFMRYVDLFPGMAAGYPSLKPNADGRYTVSVVTLSQPKEG